ncbi:hypothetical protein [Metabacillus halosaccharovorans]|uniref:hypothetical protein n=1 Tax=Metabacillus halosaccharovorans TaxID=930124 RepID=UPI001C1F29F4|nr:hypothetical protein [Metabacillus halosaccharovorans]MBU7593870.1 hypothetical protein [Metabacillus halosaccharovorans]
MAKIIDDFNVSTPTTSTGGVNRPVPTSPATLVLAEFGLNVFSSATNLVQLIATVGVSSLIGLPNLNFQLIRDTGVIFSISSSTLAVGENDEITFSAADRNVPLGFHVYRLTVTNLDPLPILNQGTVVGPITFSGMTIV